MTTVWGDDERFVNTYSLGRSRRSRSTRLRLGIRDKDGYYFILGRTAT